MIIGFIAKYDDDFNSRCMISLFIAFLCSGMQSKKLARLEHHLTENLKLTHNRIWSGMTKDVSYLRRIMNEVHMMKLKVK